jgi:5-methylcytosine-specific restriction protein A
VVPWNPKTAPSKPSLLLKEEIVLRISVMPATYKEPRLCECGYTSSYTSNWSTHKRKCKLVFTGDKERIASLEKDKQAMREQLAVKDEQYRQLAVKDEHYQKQLAAKDEKIAAKDEQIKELIERLIATHTPPPIRPGAARGTKRKKMTEPQRRKIALRQNFKCANPDGKCKLTGSFEEYDVDHVIPLFLDGDDEEWNMQALCPACHRRKTENEVLQAPNGSG